MLRILPLAPLAFASVLLFSAPSFGEDTAVTRLNSPLYEQEAVKLRAKPTRQYEFQKALLGDVLRFLATDSEISFFSLPDGSPEGEKLVSFNLNASPFQALETLCKANGLALVLDGGIWFIRSAEDRELMGRSYEVKHNSFEKITKESSGSGSGSSSSGSSSSSSASNSNTSGSSGGGVQGGGIDLQGPKETFKTARSELVNDIRSILDLPPETGDGTGSSGSSAAFNPVSAAATGDPSGGADSLGGPRRPKILWKSDSNTLYVVATRQQHMWVEGYLAAADRPQPNIAIEVKFFETSRDPSSEFGVDWTGTFGGTGTFRQFSSLSTDANGNTSVTATAAPQTENGFRMDAANFLSTANLNNPLKAYSNPLMPLQAVLSAQDVSVRLRALLNDQRTKTVSYPRMVTTNNREVVIRSVINQPVLGGASSTSSGGGSTTTAAVSYIPIGTVLNILPKKMQDEKINLNISITISTIVGRTVIQGNPYPVASSRVYGAPVEVNSGYTVAIGGLDEATETESDSGLPVLNRIPLLGYLFKTHSKQKNHKNLMIFITPRLIDPNNGGLPPQPESVLPRRPDKLMPHAPRILADGNLEGGVTAMPNAIAYMQRHIQEIGQTISENRGTSDDFKKITELQTAVKRLRKVNERWITENPSQWEQLKTYDRQLGTLSSDCERQRCALLKKGYY